jgi:hypothetical protein
VADAVIKAHDPTAKAACLPAACLASGSRKRSHSDKAHCVKDIATISRDQTTSLTGRKPPETA